MLFNDLLDFYTDSSLSVFASDINFNLVYCNNSAKTAYPYFSTPEGFKSIFSEEEWEGFAKISKINPSFTAEGSDTVIEGTFFSITRVKDDGYILIPDVTASKNSKKAKEVLDKLGPVFLSETDDILTYSAGTGEKGRRITSSVYRLRRFHTNIAKYKLLSCAGIKPGAVSDAAALMHSVEKSVKILTAHKTVGFSFNIAGGNAFINCDAEDLAYAVCQLISNSIKFSGKSVFSEISLKIADEKVIISVKDNGLGMKKDILSHCTEPYFSYNFGSSKPLCAGLGLTIVKLVCVMYGGRFSIFSHPKTGTEAVLTFPVITDSISFKSKDSEYDTLCRRIVPIALSDSINITEEEVENI